MATRTISLKILSHEAAENFAFQQYLKKTFGSGLRGTSGIRSSDDIHKGGRFNYEYYSYVLLTFEVDEYSDGSIRPTSRAVRESLESRD